MPSWSTHPRSNGCDGILRDACEEIIATNAVLTAMGRSASDLDLVFGAIVDSARRLCRADAAVLSLVDGPHYRLARTSGVSAAYLQHMIDHPYRRDGESLHGRLGLERRALQINDVLADPEFGRQDAQQIEGFRSTMGSPMMLDDEVIGVLLVWRTDVDPFEDRAIALPTAFASAAAIAVRNVDLVRAQEARSVELAHKVDQLEALGKLGEAVSSSLDLGTVLSTIVMHAVQMSGADGGSLMEFDDAAQHFFVRTAYGTSDETLERLRNVEILVARHVRRPRRTGGAPAADRRPDRLGPRRPSTRPVRDRLAVDGGDADAARGSDRRRPGGPAAEPGRVPGGDLRALADLRQPVRPGHPQREVVPRPRAADGRAAGRQPPQVGIPRQHVARAAHPAQCGHRLLGSAARPVVRRAQRAPARVPAGHLDLGQASPPLAERHPRPVQGRSWEVGAGDRLVLGQGGARLQHLDDARAGDATRPRPRARRRRRRRRGRQR